MPLVVLTGFPCSGKSETAKKLSEYFSTYKQTNLVKEDEVPPSSFDRNIVFSSAEKEKELRNSLKEEVKRHLSKDVVVIVDSGNYTKGYRHELYYLSKQCKTTHCVIHCDMLSEDCWAFNEQRPHSVQYNRETFDALVLRFESPSSYQSCECPLFFSHKDKALPLPGIHFALFRRLGPIPNPLTQCQPLLSINYLDELDKLTQDIVKAVMDATRTCDAGDLITVPKAQQKVRVSCNVSAGTLARVRCLFIYYAKMGPASDCSQIPDMFVQFLNKYIYHV